MTLRFSEIPTAFKDRLSDLCIHIQITYATDSEFGVCLVPDPNVTPARAAHAQRAWCSCSINKSSSGKGRVAPSVTMFALGARSVHAPYMLRSYSVHDPFMLRSCFVHDLHVRVTNGSRL